MVSAHRERRCPVKRICCRTINRCLDSTPPRILRVRSEGSRCLVHTTCLRRFPSAAGSSAPTPSQTTCTCSARVRPPRPRGSPPQQSFTTPMKLRPQLPCNSVQPARHRPRGGMPQHIASYRRMPPSRRASVSLGGRATCARMMNTHEEAGKACFGVSMRQFGRLERTTPYVMERSRPTSVNAATPHGS